MDSRPLRAAIADEEAHMRSGTRVFLVEIPALLLTLAVGSACGIYIDGMFLDWPELAQWKTVTLCMVGFGTLVACIAELLLVEIFASLMDGRDRRAIVLMRGTSCLLFAAAVVAPVYCLAFWLLTGFCHPSTIAAFLLVEWLCAGVGVYMLRSARNLDDYGR
ncbi:hypothetical protein BAAM0499_04590 [Bifidobacterium animalis subsp. animalis MCC 0499]|uniref:hypothetical protein n=1 Tax=Bifidobacterium animalis TaxID=28025 RepID=UPI0006A53326|nr:hypothetical protein [Bifidobacterium animalis]KOA61078.1 hypothetical protein BAAM0499_04590 [Bifidobacterium animalis subsp. animalis MCC 0499]